jgi:hypothetical protein
VDAISTIGVAIELVEIGLGAGVWVGGSAGIFVDVTIIDFTGV